MLDQMMSEKTLQGNHTTLGENGHFSPRRLEGKVAVVTGGGRGIGEAIVRLFVRHGAKVIIADIDDASGLPLANQLHPSTVYAHCDVTVEEDIKKSIDLAVSRYGKLDILVNNAGLLGKQTKDKLGIADFDADEFDQIMRLNVRGAALGMKHAAKVMVPKRSGSIITTASVAGVLGGLGPHSYTASKHAIVGLSKNTACELGKYGIRVNCISPFGVATAMLVNAWRKKKFGKDQEDDGEECSEISRAPSDKEVEKTEEFVGGLANLKGATLRAEDIAEAAVYLASDESKYVSGHNLVVDGGVTTSKNVVGF